MPVPVQITFRGVPASDAVLALMRQAATPLRARCAELREVDVTLSPASRRRRRERVQARVSLLLPRRQLVAVAAVPGRDEGALLAAVAEALARAEELLQERARQESPQRRGRWRPALVAAAAAMG